MNINRYIELFKKIYKFCDDDTLLYASSMSFSTLFAAVPILMLSIYIIDLTPFLNHYSDSFKHFITNVLIADTLRITVIDHIERFLKNIHKLGFIGSIYAIFVYALFISTYEQIMSKIFSYRQKPMYIYIKKYALIAVFMPILTIILIILKTDILIYLKYSDITSPIITFIITWVISFILYFTAAYKHITKSSIIISSLIFTLVVAVVKTLFVYYIQINFAYNEIYSSFSVLLFFILSIYIYWMLYFYGLKMAILIERKNRQKQIFK